MTATPSSYVQRERALIMQLATATVADPRATDADVAAARRRLEDTDRVADWSKLTPQTEGAILEHLLGKVGLWPPRPSDAYFVWQLACAAQTLADDTVARLEEMLASGDSAARSHKAPRCSRCRVADEAIASSSTS